MIKKIIPLLIVFVTAGFLVSCGGGSTNPLIEKAESSVKSGNNEAALAAAKQSIEQYPNDPLGYYYKGVALGQKAQNMEDPEAAADLYAEMNDAFETANAIADTLEEAPPQIAFIGNVKTGLWQTEHNTGIKYAQDDSLMATVEDPYQVAVAHLENATIILPDSALSYEVLATINSMRENYGAAATAQEQYIELAANPDVKSYRLLAQYYLYNDQPEKAVETLENARERFPQNIGVVEALADAYSRMGESEKAIAIVEGLVEQDPANAQYHLSLGTQLYKAAMAVQAEYDENLNMIFELRQKLDNAQGNEAEELKAQIQKLKNANEALRAEIDRLTDRAIVQLNQTLENRPNDEVAYNTLGIIYQNKAAVIFDQRNMTTDNQKAAELDKKAKAELRKAMENYEKAAEINPDNKAYWRSLFEVYTALGMDEKAAEAEAKAGMK